MPTFRTVIPDFQLANPIYSAGQVTFYLTDNDGVITTTLATLYAGPTGANTVANPQLLDSEGKFTAPVYVDAAVIAQVVAANVGSHSTGVIGAIGPSVITAAGTASYETEALAAVAALPLTSTYVETKGRFSAGDGGAGSYLIQASDPAGGSEDKFQLPNSGNRWARNVDTVLRLERMPSFLSYTGDCRQAFTELASEITWRGGGRVELPDCKTITAFAINVAGGIYDLMTLSGVKGFRFNGNGSKITSPMNFISNNIFVVAIRLDGASVGCFDTEINDLNLDQSFSNMRDPNFGGGFVGVLAGNTVQGLSINRLRMLGGHGGLFCNRNSELSFANRARNIEISIDTREVFYPVGLQSNGDQVYANIKSSHAGRTFDLYNVTHVEADVTSDASDGFNDILVGMIGVLSESERSNTTSNIRINYTNRPNGAYAGVNSYMAVTFGSSLTGTAGTIRDVKLNFDIDISATPTITGSPLIIIKNFAAVSTGFVLDGLDVSGNFIGSSFGGANIFQLMTESDWTGNTIRGLNLHDIIAPTSGSSAIVVDGRGIVEPWMMSRVQGANLTLTLTNGARSSLRISDVSLGDVSDTPVATVIHSGGLGATSATMGTDSTPVVTETYIVEVFVPRKMTLTGISVLNGSAVAGNMKLSLATSAGVPIAAAITASTAVSGTAAFQQVPFAVPYVAFPGKYYVLLQNNNTSNRYRSHDVGNFGATKKTAETYGTFTTFTPPPQFFAGYGPVCDLY